MDKFTLVLNQENLAVIEAGLKKLELGASLGTFMVIKNQVEEQLKSVTKDNKSEENKAEG